MGTEGAGGGAAEDAGVAEEVEGEAAALVADGELIDEGLEGGGEEGADAVDGVAPELVAALVEGGLEGGVVETPLGDGDAMDADFFGDDAIGVTFDEEVDSVLLLEGESPLAFVVFCSHL